MISFICMERVFSGVRPSGELQLGNYLGAIRQWVEMQDEYDCVFSVVDYHGITTRYDAKNYQKQIKEHLLFYLASGLDPKKCTLFIQSQNTDHTELAWLLNTVTSTSELERMIQFKEKASKEKFVSAGLFDYPVLMAADILLYDTDVVPVGEDQAQHVELAGTLAKRFNHRFGEIFKVPQVKLVKHTARIMSLDNPEDKMSKSGEGGEDKSRINLRDSDEEIKNKIKRAVTDSGKEIEYSPKKRALANLLRIYSACSGEEIEEIVAKFKGKGYAEFKEGLAEAVIKTVAPIRDKKEELEKDDQLFEKVTTEGLKKAKKISTGVLERAKKAAGLL